MKTEPSDYGLEDGLAPEILNRDRVKGLGSKLSVCALTSVPCFHPVSLVWGELFKSLLI